MPNINDFIFSKRISMNELAASIDYRKPDSGFSIEPPIKASKDSK
jgi:hypothetical protein